MSAEAGSRPGTGHLGSTPTCTRPRTSRERWRVHSPLHVPCPLYLRRRRSLWRDPAGRGVFRPLKSYKVKLRRLLHMRRAASTACPIWSLRPRRREPGRSRLRLPRWPSAVLCPGLASRSSLSPAGPPGGLQAPDRPAQVQRPRRDPLGCTLFRPPARLDASGRPGPSTGWSQRRESICKRWSLWCFEFPRRALRPAPGGWRWRGGSMESSTGFSLHLGSGQSGTARSALREAAAPPPL